MELQVLAVVMWACGRHGRGPEHSTGVCYTQPSAPRHFVPHTANDLQVQGGLGMQSLWFAHMHSHNA
jgi:hypothetical protein